MSRKTLTLRFFLFLVLALTATSGRADSINGGLSGDLHGQVSTSDTNNTNPPEPVPEPATLLLFGSGLAGVGGFLRKRQREHLSKDQRQAGNVAARQEFHHQFERTDSDGPVYLLQQ